MVSPNCPWFPNTHRTKPQLALTGSTPPTTSSSWRGSFLAWEQLCTLSLPSTQPEVQAARRMGHRAWAASKPLCSAAKKRSPARPSPYCWVPGPLLQGH